jgi:hypothetical protein
MFSAIYLAPGNTLTFQACQNATKANNGAGFIQMIYSLTNWVNTVQHNYCVPDTATSNANT